MEVLYIIAPIFIIYVYMHSGYISREYHGRFWFPSIMDIANRLEGKIPICNHENTSFVKAVESLPIPGLSLSIRHYMSFTFAFILSIVW